MGSTRDFITATLADVVAPSFRRPVEDIIYETLDRRQIPTRTDFKELRDTINTLRSQSSGATNGIKKIKEGLDDLEESFGDLESQLVDANNAIQQLRQDNESIRSQMTRMMEQFQSMNESSPVVEKEKKNVSTFCKMPECSSPQRAWGLCAPHYAKWRRGTLPGFIPYNGQVQFGDSALDLTEHKGKAIRIEGNTIWIDGEIFER